MIFTTLLITAHQFQQGVKHYYITNCCGCYTRNILSMINIVDTYTISMQVKKEPYDNYIVLSTSYPLLCPKLG